MKLKQIIARTSLALALSAAAVSPSIAQDQEWHGTDKIAHFAGSTFFAFVSSAALNEWAPEHAGFVESFALGMVPGVLREVTKAGGPCLQDFAWDVLGASLGAALGTHFFVTPVTTNGQVTGAKLSYVDRF